MASSLLGALLRLIFDRFHSRLSDSLDALKAAQDDTGRPLGETAQAKAVHAAVFDARHQAWAAACVFLRREAMDAGADDAWLPSFSSYSLDAVRRAVRECGVPITTDEGARRLRIALDSHVMAAARRAVVDAVTASPQWAAVLASDADLKADLKGFPPDAVDDIVDDVRRLGRMRARGRPADADLARAADMADVAVNTLEEAGAGRALDKAGDAGRPVPDSARRDLQGRVIARPFAWARVTTSENPCGFCVMLAGRGPVYSSSTTAGARADAYHTHCSCIAVPVYTSRQWEGKEAAEKAAHLYDQVVRSNDLHTAEARTAMDNATRGKRSAEKSAARNRRKENG